MASRHIVVAAALALTASCGGPQAPASPDDPGQSHATDPEPTASGEPGEPTSDTPADAGTAEPEPAAPEGPAVTFRLRNTAEEELVLNMDKGWQPVISAYSGKPPNAVPILMFSTFCTAACDADPAARCPSCPEPTRVRDIKKAEKREVIAAGASLDVPWDAQVFVYEATEGCQCYRKQPVPPGTYTVRACGLRITSSAKVASKYPCVTAEASFPSDVPLVVEFEFPGS